MFHRHPGFPEAVVFGAESHWFHRQPGNHKKSSQGSSPGPPELRETSRSWIWSKIIEEDLSGQDGDLTGF